MFIFVFFFKQKTAYEMRISDWSSDVCSSDLGARFEQPLSVRLECRHHAERLPLPIRARCAFFEADQFDLIVATGLDECPAHTQIAHQALREIRCPAKTPY